MQMRERIEQALMRTALVENINDKNLAPVLHQAVDAVLEAMRTPTKEMLQAVDDEADDPMVARGRACSAWVSMIDAARTKETV